MAEEKMVIFFKLLSTGRKITLLMIRDFKDDEDNKRGIPKNKEELLTLKELLYDYQIIDILDKISSLA